MWFLPLISTQQFEMKSLGMGDCASSPVVAAHQRDAERGVVQQVAWAC